MASTIEELVKKSQQKINNTTTRSSSTETNTDQTTGVAIQRQDTEYIQGPSKSGGVS